MSRVLPTPTLVAVVFTAALTHASVGQAQIYRCDTEDGLVFADEPCGKDAERVEMAPESSGIAGGPPEAVQADLKKKSRERREAAEELRKAIFEAELNRPSPPVIIQQPAPQPVLWPWTLRPRPPHHRPPHNRPPPQRPPRPPRPEPLTPDTLRPRN